MNLPMDMLDSRDYWLLEYELSYCLCLHVLLDDKLRYNILWVSVKMSKMGKWTCGISNWGAECVVDSVVEAYWELVS